MSGRSAALSGMSHSPLVAVDVGLVGVKAAGVQDRSQGRRVVIRMEVDVTDGAEDGGVNGGVDGQLGEVRVLVDVNDLVEEVPVVG